MTILSHSRFLITTISIIASLACSPFEASAAEKMERLGTKVRPYQSPRALEPGTAELTPYECEALGGQIKYHSSCSGTQTKCVVKTADGKTHESCITKAK